MNCTEVSFANLSCSIAPSTALFKSVFFSLSYLYSWLKAACLYKLETIRLDQQRQLEAIFFFKKMSGIQSGVGKQILFHWKSIRSRVPWITSKCFVSFAGRNGLARLAPAGFRDKLLHGK